MSTITSTDNKGHLKLSSRENQFVTGLLKLIAEIFL